MENGTYLVGYHYLISDVGFHSHALTRNFALDTGGISGEQITIKPAPASAFPSALNVSLAGLAGGGRAFAYNGMASGDGGIKVRWNTENGTALPTITIDPSGQQEQPEIVGLAKGGLAVVWRDVTGPIQFATYNELGVQAAAPANVGNPITIILEDNVLG